MKLRELSVQTIQNHVYQKKFNCETWCIVEMYWNQIKNLKTNKLAKVVVFLGDNREPQIFGNVYSSYKSFDFEIYFGLPELDRKRIVLDVIHNELLNIASKEDISMSELNNAYNYCLENNLENRWLFKDKYFLSTDGQYYGAIECLWELNRFEAIGIILDHNKKVINKKIMVKIEPYLGDFIYWAKCGWNENEFYLQSKQGEKWGILR